MCGVEGAIPEGQLKGIFTGGKEGVRDWVREGEGRRGEREGEGVYILPTPLLYSLLLQY